MGGQTFNAISRQVGSGVYRQFLFGAYSIRLYSMQSKFTSKTVLHSAQSIEPVRFSALVSKGDPSLLLITARQWRSQ